MTQPASNAVTASQRPLEVPEPLAERPDTRALGATSLAGTVAEPVADLVRESAPKLAAGLDELADTVDQAGPALSLLGHLFGDDTLAESAPGAVVSAVARTAIDLTVDRVVPSTDPISAVLVAADDILDVDDAPKVFTAFARSANPAAMLRDALYGAADAATALGSAAIGDMGAAHRQAERVGDNALAGQYGVLPQIGTIAVGLATSPLETANQISDTDARTGERGLFLAWGNAASDLWDEAVGNTSAPPRVMPVAEAERRAETFWGRWQ